MGDSTAIRLRQTESRRVREKERDASGRGGYIEARQDGGSGFDGM